MFLSLGVEINSTNRIPAQTNLPIDMCLFDFTTFVISRSFSHPFVCSKGWHAFPIWVSVSSSPIFVLRTSDCRPRHQFLFLTKLNNLPRFTAEVSWEDSLLLILQFGLLPSCDAFLSLWIRCIPQYYGGLLPDIFTVWPGKVLQGRYLLFRNLMCFCIQQ